MKSGAYTDAEKELIPELYYRGHNTVEIAEQLGRGRNANVQIGRYLRKAGIKPQSYQHGIPFEHKVCMAVLYDGPDKWSIEMIRARVYPDYHDDTIRKVLVEMGCEIRPGYKTIRMAHEDFFSVIDTEAKAYYLGLLTADGCVQIPGRKYKGEVRSHEYVVSLTSIDKEIPEGFRAALGTDRKLTHIVRGPTEFIYKGQRKVYNCRDLWTCRVNSRKLVGDLKELGIEPNKSEDCHLPRVSDDFMPHLLRGILDGDGTIFRNANGYAYCGWYGTHELCTELSDFLVGKLGVTKTIVFDKWKGQYKEPLVLVQSSGDDDFDDEELIQQIGKQAQPGTWTEGKEHSVSMVYWGKKDDLRKIYEYLYRDASLYLMRKQTVFSQVVENGQELVAD